MWYASVLAFNINVGQKGGPVGLVVGLIALAIVIYFAWEFGKGTADSSTVLLRGIRRRRHVRETAHRGAPQKPGKGS